ncbi:uncharacterized protein [Nicotiana tomentosiformis]|uniref:uncharacterized protein n=1 Tax=Nicotiana tomentosiformis TaxID=4098 RepID=UPI00388CA1B5
MKTGEAYNGTEPDHNVDENGVQSDVYSGDSQASIISEEDDSEDITNAILRSNINTEELIKPLEEELENISDLNDAQSNLNGVEATYNGTEPDHNVDENRVQSDIDSGDSQASVISEEDDSEREYKRAKEEKKRINTKKRRRSDEVAAKLDYIFKYDMEDITNVILGSNINTEELIEPLEEELENISDLNDAQSNLNGVETTYNGTEPDHNVDENGVQSDVDSGDSQASVISEEDDSEVGDKLRYLRTERRSKMKSKQRKNR